MTTRRNLSPYANSICANKFINYFSYELLTISGFLPAMLDRKRERQMSHYCRRAQKFFLIADKFVRSGRLSFSTLFTFCERSCEIELLFHILMLEKTKLPNFFPQKLISVFAI